MALEENLTLEVKYIEELNGLNFYVPSYQRGYRWSKKQVHALLDDLNEAKELGEDYCIQPLIVKRLGENNYEVVDGQQRLTTIFVFMKTIEQLSFGFLKSPFSLEYETRSNCKEFFDLLKDDAESCKKRNEEKEENIDFHHIAEAYDAMSEWFAEYEAKTKIQKADAMNEMQAFIKRRVFFIWYEIPADSDPIKMFTKVNLGKISLTNAELIKALFLNKDNFKSKKKVDRNDDEEVNDDSEALDVYKNELEIALEWDAIERGLNDDAFWYFLQEGEPEGPRMDLLLNLLAREKDPEKGARSHEDHDYAFSVLDAILKEAEDRGECVNRLWHEVSQMYSDFRYWYSNEDLYHIIGYLIYAGVSLREIREITRSKSKRKVISDLIARAKQTVQTHIFEQDKLDLHKVQYGKPSIKMNRQILLLFNVATLFYENRQEYRFPFKLFKAKEPKWDIEHIHATNNKSADPDDSLGNLTLLAAPINRSFKDKDFSFKREFVMEQEARGLFSPVCTKNVFLKAYTDSDLITDMDDWYDYDKEAYLKKMKETLEAFFAGKKLKDEPASDGGGKK